MDHPIIKEIERTGYPKMDKVQEIKQVMNECGCGYEAEIIYKGIPLCSVCCEEEGIKII